MTGDKFAGETFKKAFEDEEIVYRVCDRSKSQLYGALEPKLNSGQVVLLDEPVLEQQLLGLLWRGGRIDHPSGEHDDWANAAAGALTLAVTQPAQGLKVWTVGGPGRRSGGGSDTGERDCGGGDSTERDVLAVRWYAE